MKTIKNKLKIIISILLIIFIFQNCKNSIENKNSVNNNKENLKKSKTNKVNPKYEKHKFKIQDLEFGIPCGTGGCILNYKIENVNSTNFNFEVIFNQSTLVEGQVLESENVVFYFEYQDDGKLINIHSNDSINIINDESDLTKNDLIKVGNALWKNKESIMNLKNE